MRFLSAGPGHAVALLCLNLWWTWAGAAVRAEADGAWIDAAGAWRGGVAFALADGTVALDAAESITLEPGDSEYVGIEAVDGGRPPGLVPWISNDGRIFVRTDFEPAPSAEPDRALLRMPPSGARYVRFVAPETGRVRFRASLWRSANDPPPRLTTLEMAGQPIAVSSLDAPSADPRYWLLRGGESRRLTVGGGRTIRIDTRYRFGADDGESRATYRLSALADDGSRWSFQHSTPVNRNGGLRADGNDAAIGELRTNVVMLGPRVRTLSLRATSDLLVRSRTVRGEQLLLPERNGAVADPLMPDVAAGRSLWDLEVSDLAALSLADRSDAALLGTWLARDNRFLGSADYLVAASDGEGNRSSWHRLVAEATRFQNQLPWLLPAAGAVHFRRFLPPRRPLPAAGSGGRVLFREQLPSKAAELGGAYFVEVGRTPDTTPIYALPRRAESTRGTTLRLLVGGEPGGVVHLRTAEGVEREVRSVRDPVAGESDGPSDVEAAIAVLLEERLPILEPADGGPIVAVGRATLELPRGTTTFRVWADRVGTEVAVQRLERSPFRLGEAEYLAWVEALRAAGHGSVELFQLMISETPPELEDRRLRDGARALWNHWQPLARRLRARYEPLAARASELPEAPGCFTVEPGVEEALSVVASWGRHGRRCLPSSPDLRRIHESLRRLGEFYVADRLLEQALLGGDHAVADTALEIAIAADRRAGDDASVLTRATAAALHYGREDDLRRLVTALLAEGSGESALWVESLLIEPPAGALERLLGAALERRWWRSFERYRVELAVEPASEWTVRRRRAEAIFEPAPDERGPIDEPMRRWRRGETRVVAAAGSEEVRPSHSMRPLRYFRATADQPLRVSGYRGETLRLEVRPIVTGADGGVPPGSIVVRGPEGEQREPLAGRVSSSMSLSTHALTELGPARSVGSRTDLEVGFDTEDGELELFADAVELLVRVEIAGARRQPLQAVVSSVAPPDAPAGESSICVASLRGAIPRRCFESTDLRLEPTSEGPGPDATARPMAGEQAASAAAAERPLAEVFNQLAVAAEGGDDAARRRALAVGESLFSDHAQPPEVEALYERIVRGAVWRRLRTVQSSGGVRRVEGLGWRPEEPRLRAKRALVGELSDADYVVVGEQRLALDLVDSESTPFRVTVENLGVPAIDLQPIEALVQLDDSAPLRLLLDADRPTAVDTVVVPAGSHRLRFSVAEPRFQHYLRVRVEEEVGGRRVAQPRQWRRDYDVSSRTEPLRLRVQGPAWVRIDAQHAGELVSTYRFVEQSGWQSLAVHPTAGREVGLFRVFVRAPGDDPPKRYAPAVAASASAGLRTLGLSLDVDPSRVPFTPEVSGAPVEVAAGGTHSVTVRARRRRLVEEEVAAVADGEDFSEVGWTYRRGPRPDSAAERHFELGLLARARDVGESTIALSGRLRLQPEASRWVFDTGLTAFGQQVDSNEWAATWSGAVSRSHRWSPRWSSRFRLSAFARELSLSQAELPGDLETVDQDIYTRYKAQHGHGARLAHSLSYSPYSDFQLWSELSARTNEEVGELDRAEAQIGVRQLVGPARFDLRYRFARFFEDDDRSTDVDRQRVTLSGYWERWNRALGRWEIGGSFSYDVREKELSGALELSRHFSEGRGLRDFRPVAAGFHRLRSVRARGTARRR